MPSTPKGPLEPTEEQLLQFMHADTRQTYEMAGMTAKQRKQLRDAEVARWQRAQKTASNEFQTAFNVYTRREQIGQGGAGYVYKVVNSSGLEFALKWLNPETASEEKRRRFKNELIFCQNIEHKNIVKVIDWGVFQNSPFFVMPCYQGSLRGILKNSIEPSKVLPIFSQILDGVEAAHIKTVIHRDLKPENILFDHSSETPIVADFGIAHFEEEELYTAVETKEATRLANFVYAAPEQKVRGEVVDLRADIYALGLMLNELFTSRVPQGSNYKTISSVSAEYGYLDEEVALMISYLPADRPQSIGEIKRRLKVRETQLFDQQKIGQLRRVVTASEIDDPLIADPPQLEAADWDKSILSLILNKPVNDKWANEFRTMHVPESLMFKGPEAFAVDGARLRIPAKEN